MFEKYLLTILICLLLIPIQLNASVIEIDKPYIEELDGQYSIILLETMYDKLFEWDSNFEIFTHDQYIDNLVDYYDFTEHQCIFSVIGDFNGDSISDVILHGFNQQLIKIIGIISVNQGFSIYDILSFERYENDLNNQLIFWDCKIVCVNSF